jgi:hypothetical protein
MKKLLLALALGTASIALAQRPARDRSGLAFALTLTNGGRNISSDHVSLRIPDPGVKGRIVVAIDGWDFSGGAFSAPLRLENETDAELLGLRVDYDSSTETSSKNAGGGGGRTSEGYAAPLTWAALGKKETSTTLPFRSAPVTFSPETNLVVIMGRVSGVAVLGTFKVEGATDATRIDLDPSGDVLLTNAAGKTVRAAADGTSPREVRVDVSRLPSKSPSARAPCIEPRRAGLVCAEGPETTLWTARDDEVTIQDAGGAPLRSFRLGGAPVLDFVFSKTGRAYLLRRDGGVTVARSF